MVQRTERIWLPANYNLMQFSHKSKNLYNHANYIFKKQLESNYFTSEYEMINILQGHPDYNSLPAQTAQQTIKLLVKSWKSYFNALKSYKKNSGKFREKPKAPGFKRKAGFHILYFTSQQVYIRNGFIKFPKVMGMKIKTRLSVKVNQARIIPKGNNFLVEIIYDRKIPHLRPEKNIISVDLGLDNLMTGVSNVSKPLIIKGTLIKSYNRWFNKKMARLSSIYKRQNVLYGVEMDYLLDKRYKKMEDFIHKASRIFIDQCIINHIDTIVVGYNEGWKQNIGIGKKNNQNFVGIPFLNLLRKIEYKAEDVGIRVIRTEESYTSKCSFLDDEEIRKHRVYQGKRIKRGLFRSSNGILLNADCNAAGNIGRKVFPKTFVKGIVDTVSYPLCLKL
jgi:IS605 OrfB family transposase